MSGTGQRAAETARSKRDEAILRVSQTLISIRSSEELFSILARELRAVANFYVMGVVIYDEKAHEMNTTSYGEPASYLRLGSEPRRTVRLRQFTNASVPGAQRSSEFRESPQQYTPGWMPTSSGIQNPSYSRLLW